MPSLGAVTSLPFYSQAGASAQRKGLLHIITITGIDGLSTGNSTLFTVPTGYTAIVSSANIRVTAVTGAATTGHASLINSTDTVDIVADTTLTSLTAVGLMTKLSPAAAAPVVAAGKIISFKVGTAYTVATVVTLAV